jgi:hypothetical protein
MPARWLRWIIVLFWLGTTGWLFWHDLGPRWQTGEPPPLLPDDVDEVQSPTPTKIFWTVLRQKDQGTDPVFRATTGVIFDSEDDTYTLHALLEATTVQKRQPVYVGKAFRIDSIASRYRVTRAGDLQSLQAIVTVALEVEKLIPEWGSLFSPLLPRESPKGPRRTSPSEPITLRFWGEVQGSQFFAHCSATGEIVAKPLQFDLPATEVSHAGSVLMPLHPVNHIRGLHLGQTWRQPLVDPLRDAFAFLPGFSGGVRWLHAQVLRRPAPLTLDDNETSCFVIEYTNEENETVGRTWVERDSDRVMQQEANLDDGHWIMKREFERRSGKRFLPP